MKPADIRNANYAALVETLPDRRAVVFRAWQAHGPRTTRELACLMQRDVLSVRPRTSELCEMGLVEVCDRAQVGETSVVEGVYRARTATEWEQWRAGQRGEPVDRQLQLV